MKTRLPKTLLLAVLAAASVNSVAYARGNYTADSADTVTVSSDTNYSDLTEAQKAVFVQETMSDSTDTNPKTMVKNGLGTLTIDQDIHLNNPLHVTEGTLAITGKTKVTSDITKPSDAIASLSVGGKNAKVVVDNASYIQERGGVYPITIGTTDGSGALELTNNATVSTRHYIFAGYGHILDDADNVRTCGGYVLGTGYTDGNYGRSSIIVDNNSILISIC